MALKKARNVQKTKKPTSAAGGSIRFKGMAAANLNPPRLPPGVYFSPSREESVGILNRWITAGRELPAGARGFISQADIYGNSPDALRRLHPPASARAGQHTWWFLSDTKFQCPGAECKRAARKVETSGYWRLDQSKEMVGDEGGRKNCFRFYLGPPNKEKTPWLMQQFTGGKDKGAGKKGAPALHKLYVTPRATADQLRGIYGEDAGPDGDKKPVPAAVPAGYFDATAALLPPGTVRGLGQQHVEVPPAHVLGQYQQQQGHYSMGMGVAPRSPSPAPAGLFEGDDDNLSMPMPIHGDNGRGTGVAIFGGSP